MLRSMAQTEDERKAKKRAKYAANADQERARNRAYQAANAEKIRLRKQAKRLANLEEARAKDAAWRAAHPEIVQANNRKYRELNPDRHLAAAKAWNEANPDRHRDNIRAWRAENPDRVADIQRKAHHRRRARLAGSNSPGVTREEWAETVEAFGGQCAYCPRPATTIDHIEPIARGGLDAPENVVPACRSCNSSKGAKPLLIWWLHRSKREL